MYFASSHAPALLASYSDTIWWGWTTNKCDDNMQKPFQSDDGCVVTNSGPGCKRTSNYNVIWQNRVSQVEKEPKPFSCSWNKDLLLFITETSHADTVWIQLVTANSFYNWAEFLPSGPSTGTQLITWMIRYLTVRRHFSASSKIIWVSMKTFKQGDRSRKDTTSN